MAKIDMEAVMEIEHGFGKGAKKPVDDAAPKRPLSAFFLWAGKERPSVIKEYSDCSIGEIAKILGKMWKKTSSEDRSKFENKAEKEKKTYIAKMEKYKKTSSYKKFQMKLLAWKIHETKKSYPRDQNAPKRNLSAYMLYIASVRSEIVKENPDMTSSEIVKEQGLWWKALSAKDRKPWTEKAEADKVKYQKKFARYMKTSDYQSWATGRDEYKKIMLGKRNKLMGIKKRPRSETKPASAKKQKLSARRSRTPKASKRSTSRKASRRSSSRKSSKRRARTPKAPKRSSRSSSRRSSRRRSARRSRTPKSTSRSKSRRSSKRSSRRTKSPKRKSRSGRKKVGRRSSSASKSKSKKKAAQATE